MQHQTNLHQTRIYSSDPALHGSAHWASRKYLQERHHGENGKIFLGYGFPEHNKARSYAITSNTQRHLLTIAPTRSGKLLTSSAPRCLEHQGSLVALDVKDGELALIAARYRRDYLGHKVVIIDPWDEACSLLGISPSRINVLDWLDQTSDDFVEDALLIASAIVADRGLKDPFWSDEARSLIMGLILYVAATPLALLPTEEKTRDLAQVRRLLNLSKQHFKEMVAGKYAEYDNDNIELVHPGMAQSANEHVRAAAARILNKAEKELSSVISTAQQNTHFLESPRIQRSLAQSDFSFEELEQGKIDIFIVLPAGRLNTYSRYLRMLISIAITAITRFKTKPDPPVYFLIEEAAALGRLEVIETAYGLMAGYGMQLHMIVQDLNQLASIYEKRWQTFIANSGVIQVFGTNDLMTADYISQLCGTTSIESLSEHSVQKRAGLFSSPSYLSREDSVTARKLITPDEIMTMHPAAQILILSHTRPIACFKTAYFMDRRYRKNNGHHIFDIHPHYADKPLSRSVDFIKKGHKIGPSLEQIYKGG